MKAAVFEKPGVLSLKDVEEPTIEKANEVLLKVEAASICGTDIHIIETPPVYQATQGII